MTKLKISGYYKPTPRNLRKLGDALLGVSSTITGYAVLEEYKAVALAALAVGVLGKFLTNFFSDED